MKISLLKKKCTEIRLLILSIIYKSKSSHIGSCYSVIEIILTIRILNMKNKDTFILSKGHAALALYCSLFIEKKISLKDVKSYNKENTYFSGHVTRNSKTKCDFSTGSLGHGLSVGIGTAIGSNKNCFVVISDGELNEGSTMEAIMLAPTLKLSNLFVFVDFNKIQSYDRIENVISYKNLDRILINMGWDVHSIEDGHNIELLNKSIKKSKKTTKPHIFICNTIKGKGLKKMEDKLAWHYKSPNQLEYKEFIKELKSEK